MGDANRGPGEDAEPDAPDSGGADAPGGGDANTYDSDALSGPDVSEAEILAAFAEADDSLHPRDVAGVLPIGVEDARDALDDLDERDLIVADEGAAGDAYRLAPGAAEDLDLPEDRVETDVEAQAGKATGTETPPHEVETSRSPPQAPQVDDMGQRYEPPMDAVESFDPPGTPEQIEQRRYALGRAYAYLRERGSATREEFVSEVFPEAPGAYEDPDDGWWERVVRPGLETLPGVEPTGDGEGFRFVGGDGPG